MINFSENDLKYIKTNMLYVMDIWDNGTKEELKNYIDVDSNGSCLETVLTLNKNDWHMFKLINTNTNINGKVEEFCIDGLGMWVWRENEFDTAEEVNEYIKDMDYCNLFETVMYKEEIKDEEEISTGTSMTFEEYINLK